MRWAEDLGLGDVLGMRLPVLLLHRLHLVFQAEFQLLQPHLFELFVFGRVRLLGERIEALRVLRMFLSQPAELFVAGQE